MARPQQNFSLMVLSIAFTLFSSCVALACPLSFPSPPQLVGVHYEFLDGDRRGATFAMGRSSGALDPQSRIIKRGFALNWRHCAKIMAQSSRQKMHINLSLRGCMKLGSAARGTWMCDPCDLLEIHLHNE